MRLNEIRVGVNATAEQFKDVIEGLKFEMDSLDIDEAKERWKLSWEDLKRKKRG